MKNKGENLIFLISQPRSGSTMTQRILAGHSQIHTQSEPWILLHPLNALNPLNIHASYEMDLYVKGAKDFIDNLPNKFHSYKTEIANAYGNLYNSVLNYTDKKYFLDKTPRYYYIINELADYFPLAKFIFLIRNPAAVLTSYANTWIKKDWYKLSQWRDDLLLCPELIQKSIKFLGQRAIAVRFEDLINEPEKQSKNLCRFLNIPFESNIIHYGPSDIYNWQFGDQVTVSEKDKPDPFHIDSWHDHLTDPQLWRVIYDYINMLGEKFIIELGYEPERIKNALASHYSFDEIKFRTLDFNSLINSSYNSEQEIKSLKESHRIKDKLIREKDKIICKNEEDILNKKNEIKSLEQLISKIEKSYTFMIGKFFLAPVRVYRSIVRNLK